MCIWNVCLIPFFPSDVWNGMPGESFGIVSDYTPVPRLVIILEMGDPLLLFSIFFSTWSWTLVLTMGTRHTCSPYWQYLGWALSLPYFQTICFVEFLLRAFLELGGKFCHFYFSIRCTWQISLLKIYCSRHKLMRTTVVLFLSWLSRGPMLWTTIKKKCARIYPK